MPNPPRKNTAAMRPTQVGHMLCWKWRRQRGNITNAIVVLHFIPRGANTTEGALQVLASAWGAGPRQAHTLIDICRGGEISSASMLSSDNPVAGCLSAGRPSPSGCTLLCSKDTKKAFSRHAPWQCRLSSAGQCAAGGSVTDTGNLGTICLSDPAASGAAQQHWQQLQQSQS